MGPSSALLLQCLLVFISLPVSKGWIVSASPRVTCSRPSRTVQKMSKTEDDENAPLFVLGVCGGIGSGKSQACKLLVSDLACVAHIDADSVAHVVYEPGSQALQEIAKEFGEDILNENGEVVRKRLGRIVFSDPSAMSKLEHIVWPHVKEEVKKRIADLRTSEFDRASTPVIVLEAAMLLDAGWEDLLDGLWVVTTLRSTALDRLVANRGLTKEDAEKRMDAQEKRRGVGNLEEEVAKGYVTACIQNEGTLQDLTRTLKEALLEPKSWKNPSVATALKDASPSISSAGGDLE